MSKIAFNPVVFLLALLATWTQRGQQRLIDYLVAENQILRTKLSKKRILLSEAQRATLGRAGKAIGRKLLEKYATIATPDTILRWHRQLIALKWTFATKAGTKRTGRSRIPPEIEQLVIQIAKENAGWGYDRIAEHSPKREWSGVRVSTRWILAQRPRSSEFRSRKCLSAGAEG